MHGKFNIRNFKKKFSGYLFLNSKACDTIRRKWTHKTYKPRRNSAFVVSWKDECWWLRDKARKTGVKKRK